MTRSTSPARTSRSEDSQPACRRRVSRRTGGGSGQHKLRRTCPIARLGKVRNPARDNTGKYQPAGFVPRRPALMPAPASHPTHPRTTTEEGTAGTRARRRAERSPGRGIDRRDGADRAGPDSELRRDAETLVGLASVQLRRGGRCRWRKRLERHPVLQNCRPPAWRRHLRSVFSLTPWRRATSGIEAPGRWLSATIRAFRSSGQGRPKPGRGPQAPNGAAASVPPGPGRKPECAKTAPLTQALRANTMASRNLLLHSTRSVALLDDPRLLLVGPSPRMDRLRGISLGRSFRP